MSFIDDVAKHSVFDWVRSGGSYYLKQFRIYYNAYRITLSHVEDRYVGEVDSVTIPAKVVAQVIDTLVQNYRSVS